MRSSFISAAILAFASAVIADPTAGFDPITAPFQDQNIPAGAPFDIVWDPSKDYTGTVTIQLLQGATPSTLSMGAVIKAGVQNSLGTYTWDVPTSLQSFATYGFTIIKDTNTTCFQYSFPFHITGLAGSSSYSASKSGPISTVTMHLSTGSNYVASTSTVSNTTTSYPTAKPTSNYTLSTTLASRTSASVTQASASATGTSSSAPAATSKSAAAAQIASGSLAMIGGFVLALAL
ncbi:hypothetical protein NA56DRAFT_467149 [Hyaloscypha hepaticicola]|uniref:Yeast cell wall synthesis Kre9/Knh1-like N-terminal domain-containing protein n=1 Tax=Hyaloscypha hepaticicola TaxID=2082293 RepID=A0A2J6QFH9_9HELO|nr:hypothetical protein NA56DRAFT_467149 [Hyaloscypha hepaticicola]